MYWSKSSPSINSIIFKRLAPKLVSINNNSSYNLYSSTDLKRDFDELEGDFFIFERESFVPN